MAITNVAIADINGEGVSENHSKQFMYRGPFRYEPKTFLVASLNLLICFYCYTQPISFNLIT